MTKKISKKKSSVNNTHNMRGHNAQHKNHSIKNQKDSTGLKSHDALNSSEFKKELLESDTVKSRYDKLFEQKLSEQYKEFRHLKEHSMQMRRFVRILMVIIIIIIIALMLLTFS